MNREADERIAPVWGGRIDETGQLDAQLKWSEQGSGNAFEIIQGPTVSVIDDGLLSRQYNSYFAITEEESAAIARAAAAAENAARLYLNNESPSPQQFRKFITARENTPNAGTPPKKNEEILKVAVKAAKRIAANGYWSIRAFIFPDEANDRWGSYYKACWRNPAATNLKTEWGKKEYSRNDLYSVLKTYDALKRDAGIPEKLLYVPAEIADNAETVLRAIEIGNGGNEIARVPTMQETNIYAESGSGMRTGIRDFTARSAQLAIAYTTASGAIVRRIIDGVLSNNVLPDSGNDKLLRQLIMKFDPRDQRDNVHLTISEYMEVRDLRDRKKAIARLEKELEALKNDELLDNTGRVKHSGGYIVEYDRINHGRGRGEYQVLIHISQWLAQAIRDHNQYTKYPAAAWKRIMSIPDATHAEAYKILINTLTHARRNAIHTENSIMQVLTVQKLLQVCDITTPERLQQTGNAARTADRINARFLREIDYINANAYATIELVTQDGNAADQERALTDYEYLDALRANIILCPPPDNDEIRNKAPKDVH